jgi:hypothetical protein
MPLPGRLCEITCTPFPPPTLLPFIPSSPSPLDPSSTASKHIRQILANRPQVPNQKSIYPAQPVLHAAIMAPTQLNSCRSIRPSPSYLQEPSTSSRTVRLCHYARLSPGASSPPPPFRVSFSWLCGIDRSGVHGRWFSWAV